MAFRNHAHSCTYMSVARESKLSRKGWTMATDLAKKQQQRRDFMVKLYHETNGNEHAGVIMGEYADEFGLTGDEFDNVTGYLMGEGLIELQSFDQDFAITHQGVVEVEAAIKNPDRATEHFAPVNVTYIQNMHNSQLQQGTHGSTQTGTFAAADSETMKRFVDLLKSELPGLPLDNDDKGEIQGDVGTIEAQIASSRPKRDIIGMCYTGIKALLAIPPVRDALSSELTQIMHQLPL